METSRVETPASPALLRKLSYLSGIEDSREYQDFRSNLRRTVLDGHRRMVLAGKNAAGQDLAKLAPSTLKGRKGSGPPTAPRGASSRIITQYRADFSQQGRDWVLSRSWFGFAAAKFLTWGARRTTRKGNAWALPARNTSGIDAATHAEIRKLQWGLLETLTRPR